MNHCQVCGLLFSRPYTLKRHVESRHSEHHASGHQCETCGKTFERKDRLARHKKIHSGADLELCERCGRGFRRDYLERHKWSCLTRVNLSHGQASQPGPCALESFTPTFIHNGVVKLDPNNEHGPTMLASGRGGKRKREQVQFIQQTRRDFTKTNALKLYNALICNELGIIDDVFDDLGRDSGRLQNVITSMGSIPMAIPHEDVDVETIRHLISLGIDFKLAGKRFPDILHKAVITWDHELVEALLDTGADVNWRFKGKTVLDMVLNICNSDDDESYDDVWKSLNVVKVLLERGAEIGSRTEDAEELLRMAVVRSNVDLVKLLVERGVPVESLPFPRHGFSHLHLAARYQVSIECIAILISHGATLDAADSENRTTALCCAAYHGDADVMTCLIKHGASINGVPGDWGATPLFKAAQYTNPATVQRLIHFGADVNICRPPRKEEKQTTALSKACLIAFDGFNLERKLEAIDVLLAAGADPNLGEDNALKNALQLQPLKVVQTLLQGGADTDLLDDDCWDHLRNSGQRCCDSPCATPWRCKGYHDAEAKLRLLKEYRDRWNR